MPYNPRPVPETGDVGELRMWLNDELKILSQSLVESNELELRASRHAPDKPREGMIVHADGSAWNPGAGQGTYRYQNGIWVKIPGSPSDFGSLYGFGRIKSLTGGATLVAADSGCLGINFNTNATVNLVPTSTSGWCFTFFTLDGGSGGNLTLSWSGGGLIGFPDGTTSATGYVMTNAQRLTLVADGGNFIAVAGNFRGAFPQGNGVIWDATSLRTVQQMSITADGSGLKLSGDATSPGNSKYYGTDSGGTKGYNSLPVSGGLTLLSDHGSVGTGTTYTVTGLGTGNKLYLVYFHDVSHNNAASQTFRVELSGDNGSTWGTPLAPNGGTTFTAATLVNGWFTISRTDKVNNQQVAISTLAGITVTDTSSRGPINALRFSPGAGNFDSGAIDIYGLT